VSQLERILYRVEEAAEALGIGRSKAYELLASGQLPVCKVGKSVRVPADALREWVRGQTVAPATGREEKSRELVNA
jgi:excisionase family DNA binding protein